MNLQELRKNWEDLGAKDPFWAVLSEPTRINNQWEEKEFYGLGVHHLNQIFEKLQLNGKIQTQQVLDFGCGVGRMTQALCERFDKVKGIDISYTMVNKAKTFNKFPHKCEYFVNPSNDLALFEANQFDLVFSYITLQHIEPKYTFKYLEEFLRVTKKNGYILFNLPAKPPLSLKILTSLIGNQGLNLFRKAYYRKKSVIEMYWIATKTIQDFAAKHQASVELIVHDNIVGKEWESYFYLIKKVG